MCNYSSTILILPQFYYCTKTYIAVSFQMCIRDRGWKFSLWWWALQSDLWLGGESCGSKYAQCTYGLSDHWAVCMAGAKPSDGTVNYVYEAFWSSLEQISDGSSHGSAYGRGQLDVYKRQELDSMPTELDELNRKVMQLEIEETALKKEEDNLKMCIRDRLSTMI